MIFFSRIIVNPQSLEVYLSLIRIWEEKLIFATTFLDKLKKIINDRVKLTYFIFFYF